MILEIISYGNSATERSRVFTEAVDWLTHVVVKQNSLDFLGKHLWFPDSIRLTTKISSHQLNYYFLIALLRKFIYKKNCKEMSSI